MMTTFKWIDRIQSYYMNNNNNNNHSKYDLKILIIYIFIFLNVAEKEGLIFILFNNIVLYENINYSLSINYKLFIIIYLHMRCIKHVINYHYYYHRFFIKICINK